MLSVQKEEERNRRKNGQEKIEGSMKKKVFYYIDKE